MAMKRSDGRRSRPYDYRVEFRHRDDSFWDDRSTRIVKARNQREAVKKFRQSSLYKRNKRVMIVDGATREPRRQKSGRYGF